MRLSARQGQAAPQAALHTPVILDQAAVWAPHRPGVFALHRRALETYITSCSFRLVVRRLEGAPELQRRASLGFGQGMMLLLFCCGVLAFVLVETHAIACSLPGGGGGDPGSTGRYLE